MPSQTTHDDPSRPHESFAHRLSCLLDGDVQGFSAEDACKAWRESAEYRAAWHRWHLIGDVMRSSELASPPERDAAFLATVRQRIAAEPPLLAPARMPSKADGERRARHGWIAPAAVAAGFVAVAGVVVVVRMGESSTAPAATLASGGTQATTLVPGGVVMNASTQPAAPAASVAPSDAAMLRDADIDRYFRAHRGAIASPATPGGAPRNVDTIVQR